MKTHRFRLLTACIVTALHPNEPWPRGHEFDAAAGSAEKIEGDALVAAGFAEDLGTDNTNAPNAAADKGKAKGKAKADSPVVTDPTVKNGTQQPPDGLEGDDVLLKVLEGTVAEIEPQLEGFTVDQLKRLLVLESEGQARKGVADAINEFDLSGGE